MYIHSFARRVLALVLTAAIAAAAALPGFAVYAMPIQTAYPQESIYLFDADTGEVLVEQNPDLPRCVASLTKMMTALLVIERGNDLNAEITIPDSLTPEFAAIKADRATPSAYRRGRPSAASTCSTRCCCPAPTMRPASSPATMPGATLRPLQPE